MTCTLPHSIKWTFYCRNPIFLVADGKVLRTKATWVIDVHGLSFDMLSMGVRATRHWQTSGRQVYELNGCIAWLEGHYEGLNDSYGFPSSQ